MVTKTEEKMKLRSLSSKTGIHFWHRCPPHNKRFDGKPYYLLAETASRKEAQIKADRWKRGGNMGEGGHARIVPFESVIRYENGKRTAQVHWLVYAGNK